MSEIISKAQQSAAIVANRASEPCQRVSKALKALSGLTLSDLSTSAYEFIEAELLAINRVTARYEITTEQGYQAIDDADLGEILDRIKAITDTAIDSETRRVLTGLRTAKEKLPEAEIVEVRQHPDIFVPVLLGALEEAVAVARDEKEPEGEAHFFAAFLLVELEVDEAFPALLSGFTLPGERAFDLFGDAVHELLPRALALFSRKGTEQIDALLQDTRVDKFVRWAASNAYKLLVRDGVISRDVAVAKLHGHLKSYIANEERDLIAPIICELSDLAAEETWKTIKAAYDRDLVDTSVVDLEFVEMQIGNGEETFQESIARCPPSGIPDTIEELSHWAAFCETEETSACPEAIPASESPVPRPNFSYRDPDQPQPVGTVRLDQTRIGRNDPCPCGSGKKFKKCCR